MPPTSTLIALSVSPESGVVGFTETVTFTLIFSDGVIITPGPENYPSLTLTGSRVATLVLPVSNPNNLAFAYTAMPDDYESEVRVTGIEYDGGGIWGFLPGIRRRRSGRPRRRREHARRAVGPRRPRTGVRGGRGTSSTGWSRSGMQPAAVGAAAAPTARADPEPRPRGHGRLARSG